jgi:hypothetical protein
MVFATMNEMKGNLPVITFASAEDWGEWLTHAAGTSKGLWLKLAK